MNFTLDLNLIYLFQESSKLKTFEDSNDKLMEELAELKILFEDKEIQLQTERQRVNSRD